MNNLVFAHDCRANDKFYDLYQLLSPFLTEQALRNLVDLLLN